MTKFEKPGPRVLLLSGYDAASHRRWREHLVALLPEFHWHTLALPPRFFRWRIRGNPLSWLKEPLLQEPWDLVVATSMVDLATLRGLNPRLARTPCLLYMHENQFAFPISSGQNASADPQMVNLYSALCADCVVFNSGWNRDSFLAGARAFLQRLPDEVPEGLIDTLRDRSRVIPVPIEDRLFFERPPLSGRACPHLLWNHRWESNLVGSVIKIVWASRWEYDKGPLQLLAFMKELEESGLDYRLCLLGERFRRAPLEFEQISQEFPHRIVQFGFADSRTDYECWLRTADIILSTALHEFQGIAVLEAVASGCVPLLPDRLSYTEIFPSDYLYKSSPDDPKKEAVAAVETLKVLVQRSLIQGSWNRLVPSVSDFSASALEPKYKEIISDLIEANRKNMA